MRAGLGPNRTTDARQKQKNVLWRQMYHYYEFNREGRKVGHPRKAAQERQTVKRSLLPL